MLFIGYGPRYLELLYNTNLAAAAGASAQAFAIGSVTAS